MDKFGKAQTLSRLEDPRFLKGQGGYVDDTAPKGALHMFVLRSNVAHGTIDRLDVSEARSAPGVRAVITAADLAEAGVTEGLAGGTVKNLDGTRGANPRRPLLAETHVRYVGEAIVAVVAETMDAARDAAELIELDISDLPVHVITDAGGEAIHVDAPNNLAFDWGLGDAEATDKALEGAKYRVAMRIADNRIICNSMEPRGAWAEWSGDGRVHLCFNGQGVWGQKSAIAKGFGIDAAQVRITNPDVGGGFGMKAMDYPENHLVVMGAKMTGAPVRWMSERTEAMLTDNGGRDLYSDAELGFDENHKIVAYRCLNLCNLGAYNSGYAQPIQSELFSKVMPGVYDIKAGYLGCKGVFTNTTPVDAYRGAGRPEAMYVLERIMDTAARQLGVDPWELRRKNFIPADAFPYKTVMGVTYDVGDFHRVLARVAETADVAGFAARKAESAKAGKLRGMGLCYYIESILGDPTESAVVEFEEDGTVNLYVGTQSNGQGHETVYAAFLSERTGVPIEDIRIIQGDSDRIASGGGTGGSRSVTVQTAVTIVTVEKMIAAFVPFLTEELGGDASFDEAEGVFRIEGSNQTPGMQEAAELARAAGREDLLRHEAKNTLEARSFPNGAHVAEMEIDPDTGVVEVAKYTVTDDLGNLLNPTLAEGQVHGGVVQGIGQAITEHVVYDENGQLLTATFMDYGMPRADNAPMIAFYSEPVPTSTNPLGMKGCGEAGTVGALAAVANGVLDAVWGRGVHEVDMPFTPHRMWQMMNEGKIAAE